MSNPELSKSVADPGNAGRGLAWWRDELAVAAVGLAAGLLAAALSVLLAGILFGEPQWQLGSKPLGAWAALALFLTAGGLISAIAGLLGLARRRARDATERERAAKAKRESEERLGLLSDVAGRLLAAEDPQRVVNELCAAVMRHLDCQVFFNFLADKPSGRLRLNACAGIPAEEAAKIEWLDYGVAVCGCVAKEGRRIVAEDISCSPDMRTELVRSYGVQAYACHPLLDGARVIGTLSFGTRNRTRFTADELALMKAVADHVAVAMQRKQAEEALRASERLYRAIGESIAYGIWVCDREGRNTYASESLLTLVGITQEQCSDFRWGNALHPDDAEETIAAWKQCVQTGGPWYREHRYRGADGLWHPILACGVPVRDERGEITEWAGINLDISRLKRTEAELRKAKDELATTNANLERLVTERTAKLQELVGDLEHFSYTITHDMRAPLRAMRGFTEIVNLACEDCVRKEPKEFLRKITTSAERMDRLITDALDYSRSLRQELRLENVDTGRLLRGMLDSYPEFQASRAHIELQGELPLVLGNEAGLTQCFSNLLGNAVKFAKPGEIPRIRIRAESVPHPAPEARHQNGGVEWVRIWVEDEGIGIPQPMLPRIFDMFSRASTKHEGTGIGLALVRKVVQRMGGRVGGESEEGVGSRFWMELRGAE